MKFKALPLFSLLLMLAFIFKGYNLYFFEKFTYYILLSLSWLSFVSLFLIAFKSYKNDLPFDLSNENIFIEWDTFGLILIAFLSGLLKMNHIVYPVMGCVIFLIYYRGKQPKEDYQ